jgi:hypothetical protein
MRFEALQYLKHALDGLRSKKGISESHSVTVRLEAQLALLRDEDDGGGDHSYPGRDPRREERERTPQRPG